MENRGCNFCTVDVSWGMQVLMLVGIPLQKCVKVELTPGKQENKS